MASAVIFGAALELTTRTPYQRVTLAGILLVAIILGIPTFRSLGVQRRPSPRRRVTVTARLRRMETEPVITGYGPTVDVAAAGFPVEALATLRLAQGRVDDVAGLLERLPQVLKAHATTGTGDVICPARRHVQRGLTDSAEDLRTALLTLQRSDVVRRSTSVVILSVVVAPWTLPLPRS